MTPPPTVDEHWLDVRQQMPVTDRWAYFDHAGVAPLPAPARDRLKAWADDAAESGDVNWSRWHRSVGNLRNLAAALITAEPDELAVVRNTTEGLSLVAEGYPWRPGDNVVITGGDFPTNVYPWLNLQSRGVEVRPMDVNGGCITADLVRETLDKHTRMVAISWVHFASGWRADLDAIAAVGARRRCPPLRRRDPGTRRAAAGRLADARRLPRCRRTQVAARSRSAGLLYVRRPHLDRLRTIGVGWNSVVQPFDYDHIDLVLKPAAARYEGAPTRWPPSSVSKQAWDCSAATRSARCRPRVGGRRVDPLSAERPWRPGRSVRAAGNRSAIVSFDFAGDDVSRYPRACRDAGVVINHRGDACERVRTSTRPPTTSTDLSRRSPRCGEPWPMPHPGVTSAGRRGGAPECRRVNMFARLSAEIGPLIENVSARRHDDVALRRCAGARDLSRSPRWALITRGWPSTPGRSIRSRWGI
ncbi:MAG: aminotransferase class V-fold PLP-dependent enzyme [Pirellulales bacterium]